MVIYGQGEKEKGTSIDKDGERREREREQKKKKKKTVAVLVEKKTERNRAEIFVKCLQSARLRMPRENRDKETRGILLGTERNSFLSRSQGRSSSSLSAELLNKILKVYLRQFHSLDTTLLTGEIFLNIEIYCVQCYSLGGNIFYNLVFQSN